MVRIYKSLSKRLVKKRPIIAVIHSTFQSRAVIFAIKFAIWLAGGKTLLISPKKNKKNFAYRGLILYGGVDICPELFGQTAKPNYHYDTARDALEFEHLAYAEQQNLPILGICRGCQLMNIARGGTLYTDIEKLQEKNRYPSSILGYIFFRKRIIIQPNSLLFNITQAHELKVNSIHKQSIFNLGKQLSITAQEKNDIVQAIEDQQKAFFLGVQFHPEFLIYKRVFLNIFRVLIQKSKLAKTMSSLAEQEKISRSNG